MSLCQNEQSLQRSAGTVPLSAWFEEHDVDFVVLKQGIEQTKATTTATEVLGFGEELGTGAFAKKVRTPVLVVVGEHDYLYKGSDAAAFATQQKKAFSSADGVKSVLIPNAAHDLALHNNAPTTTDLINRWALSNAN